MDPQHARNDQQTGTSKDDMLAELLFMGFEISAALEALEMNGVVSIADAVEFLLAGSSSQHSQEKENLRNSGKEAYSEPINLGDRELPVDRTSVRQSPFSTQNKVICAGSKKRGAQFHDSVGDATLELLKKQRKYAPHISISIEKEAHSNQYGTTCNSTLDSSKMVGKDIKFDKVCSDGHVETSIGSSSLIGVVRGEEVNGFLIESGKEKPISSEEQMTFSHLETQAQEALKRHFGYKNLKNFQLEALKAWATHQDCLVLAATGSGKSLCFQLPALLTGKVVVVVSPLISLMHDQCLQLSKRGISACFLGSGQMDKTVEKRAMTGMYSIVYVCPETLKRLLDSLKQLAQGRGIALFAIDEAHCISKWGHDFRPDYRRLSILRETFKAHTLPGLKHDIPIMALTATATQLVQEDILDSLGFNKRYAKTVRTTLFRPNLRFSVHHSKTGQPSSYEEDFKDLVNLYVHNVGGESQVELRWGSQIRSLSDHGVQGGKSKERQDIDKDLQSGFFRVDEEVDVDGSERDDTSHYLDVDEEQEDRQLKVEDLEDEDETERLGGDFDVSWKEHIEDGSSKQKFPDYTLEVSQQNGPTIIYMPTRKETERLAKFLCKSGVKAASYHAKMPKEHLRKVHTQFHDGSLQVVVATIAFGMGIDKPNVRRIIHYGWPQSLEAYYQEAGRAGRDGLLSECTLYCDMTVLPSLLPSRRSPEQTRHSLSMLEKCFRYGLSTSKCRVDILLSYFGEEFLNCRCNICDVCTMGPPPLENLTKEAEILLNMLAESQGVSNSSIPRRDPGKRHKSHNQSFRLAIEKISECSQANHRKRLWWRGFGRILEDSGFLKEANQLNERNKGKLMVVPCLKFPEVTMQGFEFLQNCKTVSFKEHVDGVFEEMKTATPPLFIYSEGDMIQALKEPNVVVGRGKEWGRGWADPEIRRQRLSRRKTSWSRRPRRPRGHRKTELNTVRERLSLKLG